MNYSHVKNKPFWIYFFAVMFSLMGINLFVYTHGWYIMDISGSKLSVGLAWSIFFTPGIFLLPIIGKMLDSAYIKTMLIRFEFSRALILLIFIPILYFVPKVYVVYLMDALFGFAFSSFYPSIYVVIKRLVPQERILKYSHMIEVSIQIASSISVILAGFLYEKWGFFSIILLGGLLIILSGFMIRSLNIKADANIEKLSIVDEYRLFFKLLKEIFRFSSNEKKIYLFGMFHQFPQNIIMASNILLMLYVYETMIKGPVEYGILDTSIGIASLLTGIFWSKYYKYSQIKLLVWLMPLFASFALVIIGMVQPIGIVPYILFYIWGTFMTSTKVQCRAAVLKTTSQETMGRLTSLYQTISYVITLILAFTISFLCKYMYVQSIFLLLAVLMFIFSIFLFWAYTPEK